jgi:uncharacterized protein
MIRKAVESCLKELMVGRDVGGHGFDHFIVVADHAVNALTHENISDRRKLQVELAALLHDADEDKIFPESVNYENARRILSETVDIDDKETFIDEIINMIDIVACSRNGDNEVPESWMAIPRDCDRLEAIGQIGIDRCREYTDHLGNPYHIDSTPRVKTLEELWQVATGDRFNDYMNGKKSFSMIDHYYDKLLHIGQPNRLRSQNPYILAEASRRNDVMIEFVLSYWRDH